MRAAIAAVLTFSLLSFTPAFDVARATGNVFGDSTVVIAVLDTGIRPTHQEFDYVSSSSTTDQLVGWWDFTTDSAASHRPTPGQTWDTTVTTPYDNHGHGTGTASMVAGKNLAGKAPAFCPGCKLAIGKVLSGSGTGSTAGIADAVKWAVTDVHADVISMSLGGAIEGVGPVPGALDTVDEAIRYAREAGVLVVVAAGNGYFNSGIAGMYSEFYAESFSTNALVVGGLSSTGLWSSGTAFSMDPEVSAHGVSVKTAYRSNDASYITWSGTSFATPQVAGMAAALLKTAIANGCSASPGYLETVLKFGAFDSVYPFAIEGYGFLGATQFNALNTTYAPSCSIPARPAADINRVYDENVAQNLRFVTSEVLDSETLRDWYLTGATPLTGPGVLGTSVPVGLEEVEMWTVSLGFGDELALDATFVGGSGGNDFDVFLLAPGSGSLIRGVEVVELSANGAGTSESLSYRAPVAGTYRVLVAGWSILQSQGYSLSATIGGSPATLTFATEQLAAGISVV